MVRALAVCVLSSRIAALRGWWPAVATNLSLIAPSWPLISLAWSASTASLANVVAAEALLVASGTALPVIGVVLRRLLSDEQRAEMSGTTLGVIFAAVLWSRDLTSFLVLA
jgi:hypothetical protein